MGKLNMLYGIEYTARRKNRDGKINVTPFTHTAIFESELDMLECVVKLKDEDGIYDVEEMNLFIGEIYIKENYELNRNNVEEREGSKMFLIEYNFMPSGGQNVNARLEVKNHERLHSSELAMLRQLIEMKKNSSITNLKTYIVHVKKKEDYKFN